MDQLSSLNGLIVLLLKTGREIGPLFGYGFMLKVVKVDQFLVAQGGINGPPFEWKTLCELHTTYGAGTKLVHRT